MPSPLARVHARFGTPHLAIVVTTLLSALLAFFFDYRKLVGMTNITVLVQYFVSCLAVPVLRYRERGAAKAEKGWKMPLGPVIPAIGVLGSILLFRMVVFGEASRAELYFAGVSLVLGIVVAFASSRMSPRPT